LQLRAPAESTRWLARAAQYPLTFYGLLGRRALGVEVPFDWSLPEISKDKAGRLLAHDGARRAIALMQIGESARAEREWRKLFPRLDRPLREPLMTIAARHNMPGLAIRLAGIIRVSTGRVYHAALFPVPSWAPAEGFTVDRALVYGIIRQESGFDPRAKSGRGARGLMQLMPTTATFMDADDDMEERHELYDPALNLQLGQRYVEHLLEMDRVGGDLFRLLVAYNAGPGNLGKWRRTVNFDDDPLLFIESIPSRETREFIERVLSNVWIYRHRLGQTAPSLDSVAAGNWAMYRAIDDETGFQIRNARFRPQ
jgi:soluble lytic murein transglycosylase